MLVQACMLDVQSPRLIVGSACTQNEVAFPRSVAVSEVAQNIGMAAHVELT